MQETKVVFYVRGKLKVGDLYCISVEGNVQLLRNGLQLQDEQGNTYTIETVGMPHYQSLQDHRKYAEICIRDDVEQIGSKLFICSDNG